MDTVWNKSVAEKDCLIAMTYCKQYAFHRENDIQVIFGISDIREDAFIDDGINMEVDVDL